MYDMIRHIVAVPERVRFLHFDGEFRLVRDAARELNARAAINAGFFSMSAKHPTNSYPVGTVVVDGEILVAINHEAMHFHCVHAGGGCVAISEAVPLDCDWAVTMGPRLLEAGKVCERSISDPRWVAGGIGPTRSDVARAAIGVRADNQVILAYWSGATIRAMAADMLGLGCVDALACDGGGSASWYNSEFPSHTVSQRSVPNMFIVEQTSTSGGGVTVAARPRVYLSPSNQPDNLGVGNYGTEQYRMRQLASTVAKHLVLAGADVAMARVHQDIQQIILDSNGYTPSYHVCLHSNAGGGKGTEGFHWPGSVKGEKLTRDIVDAVSAINPGGFRRVVANPNLAEISGPSAPSVYIEVGFHDSVMEAAWIVQDMEQIGLTIAQCVCRVLGLAAPETTDNCALIRGQLVAAQDKLAEIKRIVS